MKGTIGSFFKKHLGYILAGIFVATSFCSCFSLTMSKDYKLEMFCNSLTLPRHQKVASYKPSMIEVEYNQSYGSFDLYQTLFETYVYNSSFNRSGIVSNSSFEFVPTFSEVSSFNAFITSQFLYTEVETKDTKQDVHVLRHGRYALYLPIKVNAGSANDFAYIPDTLADQWIESLGTTKLGILPEETKAESYTKLLAYLDLHNCLFAYNGPQTVTFKVINVYYTDFGYAPRFNEVHGQFILSYTLCKPRITQPFEYHFEVETHIDTFANKRFLKSVEKLYGLKANMTFYTPFGNSEGKLELNVSLNNEYQTIRTLKDFSWGYILALLSYILFAACLFLFDNKMKSRFGFALFALFAFVLYGFLSTYLYFYSLFGVVVIVYLVTIALFFGKEVVDALLFKKQPYNKEFSRSDVFNEVDV